MYHELRYLQLLQEEVGTSLHLIVVKLLTSDSLFDACKKGGWQLGHLVDGTQAEYIRMPFADSCLYPVPDGADERSLLVYSDILPTGLEVGVLRGTVQPGKTIAIVSTPMGRSVFATMGDMLCLTNRDALDAHEVDRLPP